MSCHSFSTEVEEADGFAVLHLGRFHPLYVKATTQGCDLAGGLVAIGRVTVSNAPVGLLAVLLT